jgi:hypothetical protein
MVILSANFLASSSTEGASALHVLQVGAQNQKATFLPTRLDPSKVPPPTSGLENASGGGIATGLADASGAGAAVVTAGAAVPASGAAEVGAAGAGDAFGAGVVVAAAAAVDGLAAGRVDVVEAPHAVSASPKRAMPTAAARRDEARSGAVRVMSAV